MIASAHETRLSSSSKPLPQARINGKDVFDSSLWKDATRRSTFYTFIASLRRKIKTDVDGASATHRFIRQLRDQRKLVRCYTQNIDGLELRVGLNTDLDRSKGNRARFTKKAVQLPYSVVHELPGKILDGGCEVVQLHGDLEVLRCTICGGNFDWDRNEREAVFLSGDAPDCPDCTKQNEKRKGLGRRGIAVGTLRPNIVLYGEEHPAADELTPIRMHDLNLSPDVLLILGTSLRVHGLQNLVKEFAKSIHSKVSRRKKVIFVNLTKPSGSAWDGIIDYHVSMDCDAWVRDVQIRRIELSQTQANLSVKTNKGMYHGTEKRGGKIVSIGIEDEEGLIELSTCQEKRLIPPKTATLTASDPPAKSGKTILSLDSILVPSRVWKTPSEAKQLPTPPNSRHNGRQSRCDFVDFLTPPASHHHSSSSRLDLGYHTEDDAVAETPSKRRKRSIQIWQDGLKDNVEDRVESPRDGAQVLMPKALSAINMKYNAILPISANRASKFTEPKITSSRAKPAESIMIEVSVDEPHNLNDLKENPVASLASVQRNPPERQVPATHSGAGRKRKRT